MCAPSMPAAPDPKQQATAQTNSNISTATANAALGNINEYTPQGSVVRKQTGTQQIWDENLGKTISVPTYSAYQTYSPQEQAIYNSGSANRLGVNALAGTMIDQVGNTVSKGIDYSKMPKDGDASKITAPQYERFGVEDYSADRQKYEDALMARMNPQLQQDQNTLEQQLLNQGLQPGSEAYNRAVDQASRQRTDARYGAILNAGTEQQRMNDMAYRTTAGNNQLQDQGFNAQLSLFGAQNTDRQNALKEAYDKYSLPINTIGALMSGGQVSQPQYAGANMPQLPNIDYAGLYQKQFSNQMDVYGAQAAQSNALIGGAGSLFKSVLPYAMASDIRLKQNIVPIGEADGHRLYAFDYRDAADGVGRQVGVMAQEVMQTRPDAVLQRADGMLMVDYSKLFGRKL